MLKIVGMPVGNDEDFSARAKKALQEADYLLCEDRRNASTFFKRIGLAFPAEWDLLNEHTAESDIGELLEKVMRAKTPALISDAGLPILCDPGETLVRKLRMRGYPVTVIPGPSALLIAIALSGVGGHGFHFLGFPPRKKEERPAFLRRLGDYRVPVVLYETPYRLRKLLLELSQALPDDKKVFVAVNLTQEDEYTLECRASDLKKKAQHVPEGPPVVIIFKDTGEYLSLNGDF